MANFDSSEFWENLKNSDDPDERRAGYAWQKMMSAAEEVDRIARANNDHRRNVIWENNMLKTPDPYRKPNRAAMRGRRKEANNKTSSFKRQYKEANEKHSKAVNEFETACAILKKKRGNGGCFPKGTLISTPFGKVDIAEIVKGDLVTSICTKTGLHSSSKVLRVCQHRNKKLWHIKLSNGSSIQTTDVHSFFDGREWKKASTIRLGDFILCQRENNGPTERRMVVESDETGAVEDVYNIIVEKDFTFIANGALANSFTNFRILRSLLWSFYSLLRDFQNDITLKMQDLATD